MPFDGTVPVDRKPDHFPALLCLIKARELIKKKHNWCKGRLTRNSFCGRRPQSYCGVGAVFKAAKILKIKVIYRDIAIDFLDEVARHHGYIEFIDFNDDDKTTHKQVIAAIDDAVDFLVAATDALELIPEKV